MLEAAFCICGSLERICCIADGDTGLATLEGEYSLDVHVKPLGSPVVPFYPFSFWVPLLKPNSRKKGTLIIKGLLGNLGKTSIPQKSWGRGVGFPNVGPAGYGELMVLG